MCPIHPIHWSVAAEGATVEPMSETTTNQELVTLGATGPRLFPLALGCMGMGAGSFYGDADEAGGIATIRSAIDRGVNLIDTGDFYSTGKNELLVGKALAGGWRDRAIISVKF